MIPCTKRAILESTLPNLTNVSTIVTSVLSNFICDAGSLALDRIIDVANAEMTAHVQFLSRYCQSHPGVKVVVVPPLSRSEPDWFTPYLPCFTTFLFSEISKLGSTQIRYLSPFVAPPTFFCTDGVHLLPEAGVQFIRFIVDGVDQVFPTVESASPIASTSASLSQTHQNSSSPPEIAPAAPSFQSQAPAPSLAVEFGRVSSALHTLTGVTDRLQVETRTRRNQDNLIFARLKEDRDFEFNKNREDRFTVTGLITEAPPSGAQDRKDFFKNALQRLVDKACSDVVPLPTVVDVFVNMRNGQGPPYLEGRMDSVASSSAFRLAASRLSQAEDPDFAPLFVANSVTLATRVQIEILRAISRVLKSDTTESFVQGFSSRPLLHYYVNENAISRVDGANRTYTFVEAVSRFGDLVTSDGLVKAYKRAHPAFIGCMEQYFVVLKEQSPLLPAAGSNLMPLGTRGSWRGLPPSRPSGRRSYRGGYRGLTGQRGLTRGPGPLYSGSQPTTF